MKSRYLSVSPLLYQAQICAKLSWAFQIFGMRSYFYYYYYYYWGDNHIICVFFSDFNEDDAICAKDLNVMLDMLTGGKMNQAIKDKIVNHVSQSLAIIIYP